MNTQLESTGSNGNDVTLTARVTDPFQPATDFGLLSLRLPTTLSAENLAGRYFLARCGAQSPIARTQNWSIYFRRPLFIVDYRPTPVSAEVDTPAQNKSGSYQFLIPYQPFIHTVQPEQNETLVNDCYNRQIVDPGYAWLSTLKQGERVNLIGPFGNGFDIKPNSRNLLLIAHQGRVAKLLPLVDLMLNQGGRVTILVRTTSANEQESLQEFLLPLLPIAVELRLANEHHEWGTHLDETIAWADQIGAAMSTSDLYELAAVIQEKRFHLQENFAQVVVDAELICGVGACLACVVQTANGGYTRACVNGPVFDLSQLSRP